MCGLCDSFYKGSKHEQEYLHDKFQPHVQEKDEVRKIKATLKVDAQQNKKLRVATLDLEQVIYLPRTNRSEVFYKRRLSCYNFTIYALDTKLCTCYLWHEGIAGRGSNEIASHLHDFLAEADLDGIEEVSLFSDGCAGQNKNTIVLSMLLWFVQHTEHVKQITLHFYETGHGQYEGDSVHSTIERSLKRAGNLYVPSQLETVIRLARKNPYNVIVVQKSDVRDWKSYSRQIGILRVHETVDGEKLDWTKIKQVRVNCNNPETLFVKMSHLEKEYGEVKLNRRRTGEDLQCTSTPIPVTNGPKMPRPKFEDLMGLCDNNLPVIPKEHWSFYKSLPHA